MSRVGKILVVDDVPTNVRVLEAMLRAEGHAVVSAESGSEALELLEKETPDLVIMDVVMPKLGGYEVCRAIRERDEYRLLPVVMASALDPREERLKAIEAGADDFLERPIRRTELLAKLRSLLRIKDLHDTVERQARELAELNRALQERVEAQVGQLERLGRLKGFFSPQLAEIIVSGGEDLLESHRRYITVVFLDLRGFTAFAEAVEAEEVMGMLRSFHAAMGQLVLEHEGTLERFTGDGMMIFFNDPVEVENPEERAVRMVLEMRDAAEQLRAGWEKLGYELDLGVGIAAGYATLGAIGFEGRFDYGAIGRVTNLSARLCDAAPPGHILISERVATAVEGLVESEAFGDLSLDGFHKPVAARRLLGLRERTPR